MVSPYTPRARSTLYLLTERSLSHESARRRRSTSLLLAGVIATFHPHGLGTGPECQRRHSSRTGSFGCRSDGSHTRWSFASHLGHRPVRPRASHWPGRPCASRLTSRLSSSCLLPDVISAFALHRRTSASTPPYAPAFQRATCRSLTISQCAATRRSAGNKKPEADAFPSEG